MSVAITAQVPVAASSPATATPQAAQGAGAASEQGLVDFFAKATVEAGQTAQATNSVASSGEMLGRLREFVEKSNQSDASNRATRAKQRAAAAEAKIDLATLDTLGPLGKLNSFGQSGSFGKLGSLNQFSSGGLPPGPASASPAGLGLDMKHRVSAMADKMTNDLMDSAIHNMWTRVVMSGTNSVTKSVMSLLKGQ